MLTLCPSLWQGLHTVRQGRCLLPDQTNLLPHQDKPREHIPIMQGQWKARTRLSLSTFSVNLYLLSQLTLNCKLPDTGELLYNQIPNESRYNSSWQLRICTTFCDRNPLCSMSHDALTWRNHGTVRCWVLADMLAWDWAELSAGSVGSWRERPLKLKPRATVSPRHAPSFRTSLAGDDESKNRPAKAQAHRALAVATWLLLL